MGPEVKTFHPWVRSFNNPKIYIKENVKELVQLEDIQTKMRGELRGEDQMHAELQARSREVPLSVEGGKGEFFSQ